VTDGVQDSNGCVKVGNEFVNTEKLTGTMQKEIFCVTQLRSSGEHHWLVARAKRVYDMRISRTESLWVQSMGPSLTHEGHATRNVSGVRLPRDVQESRGGRKARKQ
jgi:hypothetical protein